MTSYDDVFIETSSMVDYALKSEYREQIEELLNSYNKKISSNYVKMELKRGVLQYLVYLHNKITLYGDWSKVVSDISKLSATPQRHRLGTLLEVLSSFFSEIGNETLPEGMSLNDYLCRKSSSYMRTLIRRLWRKFDQVIDENINPMSCFIDIQSPIFDENRKRYDNSPSKCTGSELECRIKYFFRENEEQFRKIRDDLEKLSESSLDMETRKRIRSLKEVLRLLPYNNRKFSNKDGAAHCWNCGDAILAVTSPEGAHVLHHNPRHYDTLCKSLNQQGITYQ